MGHPSGLLTAATRAAVTAELFWVDDVPAGSQVESAVGTPLMLGGLPTFAFTYAHSERAQRLGSASQVAVVYSDSRVSGPGWRPLVALGRPLLTPDPDGEIFTDRLLEQELLKVPPSRALADSAILRREHWWYLPRLIITVAVDGIEPIRQRPGGPGSAVLGCLAGGQLEIAEVSGERLAELENGPPVDEAGCPAALIGHDFTPDLEQWLSWSSRGRLVGDRLQVEERTGRPQPATGLSLRQRLARHRELSRACRRNLRRLA